MSIRLLPILLLLAACGGAEEHTAHKALIAGNTAFDHGEWTTADSLYNSTSPTGWLLFNSAHARVRTGDLSGAIERATEAEAVLDSAVWRSRARYDKGTAYLSMAAEADSLSAKTKVEIDGIRTSKDIVTLLTNVVLRDSLQRQRLSYESLVDSTLREGTEALRNALRADPRNEDARHNLMLGMQWIAARPKPDADKNDPSKKKQEQPQLTEKAKAILARADELVEKHRFADALQVLKQGLQQDPTLGQKKEYMDKLEVVTNALGRP